jgi:hypothetical protein
MRLLFLRNRLATLLDLIAKNRAHEQPDTHPKKPLLPESILLKLHRTQPGFMKKRECGLLRSVSHFEMDNDNSNFKQTH